MRHQPRGRVIAASTFLGCLLAAVVSGCGGTAEVANQERDSKALANEVPPTAETDEAVALFGMGPCSDLFIEPDAFAMGCPNR